MSLDLPLLPSRYPDQWPTFDLSQFLVNGCVPVAPGSVMATVSASHVYWDIRIRTADILDPNNQRFFENLPADLVPGVGATRLALHGNGTARVQWNAAYRFMQIFGVRLDAGELSFEARTLRRPV